MGLLTVFLRLPGEKTRALVFYLVLVSVLYAPVVFCGRSLVPTLYYSDRVTPPGAAKIKPVNTFNIDLGTPAFFEFPANEATGRMWRGGEWPLWNPYQAAGTPWLAQYSTRAFFPYQIAEDLCSWRFWDYWMLGRLVAAGFFTFLFLRMLGLSFRSSLLGGAFYIFSGCFTWFVNLEQFANVALTVPLFMAALEGLARRPGGRSAALFAFALFLLLTAGQPEMALYVCLLGLFWFAFRAGCAARSWAFFILAFFLGAGMSLPVILPFLELVANGFTPHPFTLEHGASGLGTVSPAPLRFAISLLVPTFHQVPTSFRIFPDCGVWDFLGGFVSMVCLFFSLVALLSRHELSKPARFFSGFALFIVLKNFGIFPFTLLGELPLFHQVWTPRWAGPAWVFPLVVAGAIGFEHATSGKKVRAGAALAALSALLILLFAASGLLQNWGHLGVLVNNRQIMQRALELFYFSSAVSGTVTQILVLAAVFVITLKYRQTPHFFKAVLCVFLAEAWFSLPKGLDHKEADLCVFPLLIALYAALSLAKGRFRTAGAFAGLAFGLALFLQLYPANGLPERRDPFPDISFVDFLKEKAGHDRALATELLLFPNTASCYGIQDLKYINSVAPAWTRNYSNNFLTRDFYAECQADELWFNAMPVKTKDMKAVYDNLEDRLKFYSFLGVRHIATPKHVRLDLPLVYDREVRIFENPEALPRAYVVRDVRSAKDWRSAQDMLPGIDLAKTAVVEKGGSESWFGGKKDAGPSAARIGELSFNRVRVEASMPDDGLLVLTDTWFPGWSVAVDGKKEEVLRVNGLVRGVRLGKGVHDVVFRYEPRSFFAGLGLGLAFFCVAVILYFRGRGYASLPPAVSQSRRGIE